LEENKMKRQSLIALILCVVVWASAVQATQSGKIVGWGGQVVGVDLSGGFVAVSAGRENSLGLKHDGSIVAWGDNSHGLCNVPLPNTGFVAVSAGYWHSLGLKSDGSIVAWGQSSSGECNVP
jgi:hypothetical protein